MNVEAHLTEYICYGVLAMTICFIQTVQPCSKQMLAFDASSMWELI